MAVRWSNPLYLGVNAPAARAAHSLVLGEDGDDVFMFGGETCECGLKCVKGCCLNIVEW